MMNFYYKILLLQQPFCTLLIEALHVVVLYLYV